MIASTGSMRSAALAITTWLAVPLGALASPGGPPTAPGAEARRGAPQGAASFRQGRSFPAQPGSVAERRWLHQHLVTTVKRFGLPALSRTGVTPRLRPKRLVARLLADLEAELQPGESAHWWYGFPPEGARVTLHAAGGGVRGRAQRDITINVEPASLRVTERRAPSLFETSRVLVLSRLAAGGLALKVTESKHDRLSHDPVGEGKQHYLRLDPGQRPLVLDLPSYEALLSGPAKITVQ